MTKEKQLGPDGNGVDSTGSSQALRKRAADTCLRLFREKGNKIEGA